MDHMEFSIALPPLVELTNAGVEWNTMKQRLYTHLNPNSSCNPLRNTGLRRPFLISIASEQVQGIFNMYEVSFEEATKFCKILQNIEDLCLPRFLIIYNRFRFFTCKQNGPEFNGFLQQLLAWSDLCEFGDLKDILLKDCIISGISEESVRQHLLRTEQLDFDKTVDICRAGLAKEPNTEDSRPSNKIFLDVSTNTDLKEQFGVLGVEKTKRFSVATNTYLEMEDKSSQTMFLSDFPQPVGNDNLMSDIHHLKPGNRNDNCDQDSLDVHLHEPSVYQGCVSSQFAIPENSEQELPFVSESFPRNVNFGRNQENVETPALRQSSRSLKPSFIPRSDEVRQQESHSISSSKLLDKASYNIPAAISTTSDESPPLKISHHTTQKGTRLKCRACKISFQDLQSLQKHKKIHEKEKKFRCDICPARFFNTSHLKVHKRLHTGERPFVCDTCGESYVEASKLKAHIRKHTGERPYKCDVCHMTFTWSAAFNRHKRTHTGEKPYACEYCGGTFADFTALQRHTRTHTKEKPYECEVCNYSFGDPSALRAHKRIHTGERPYNCKFCASTFTRAQHVKEHMKLHLGEKPFKCETCGAAFVEASKLKSHKRRHTGEKPYQCKICGASFAWTAAYTRHMRTHTFEKPYSCKVCGCTFADHSTLIRHHRTHTGERPYHCNLCGAQFADSSSLSRHQRIHSGEKAFTCEICGASFAVKSYLNRHMRIHTGVKPYNCDHCESKFSDSSKLKRHQKIHERARLKEDKQQFVVANVPPPPVYPNMALRHELPHFQDEEILTNLSKPYFFDHVGKPEHQFEPLHGHEGDVSGGLGLSFTHSHEEGLGLAPSVSASLGMAPGMESLANILSFDS